MILLKQGSHQAAVGFATRDVSEQTTSEARQSYVSLEVCPAIASKLLWKSTSIINNSRTIGELSRSAIIILTPISSSHSA